MERLPCQSLTLWLFPGREGKRGTLSHRTLATAVPGLLMTGTASHAPGRAQPQGQRRAVKLTDNYFCHPKDAAFPASVAPWHRGCVLRVDGSLFILQLCSSEGFTSSFHPSKRTRREQNSFSQERTSELPHHSEPRVSPSFRPVPRAPWGPSQKSVRRLGPNVTTFIQEITVDPFAIPMVLEKKQFRGWGADPS